MTERPNSGNRWEPADTQPFAATATPAPAPVPPPAPTPFTPQTLPSPGWRAWPASVWTAIVAVGVAAFLASGIVGYAVGSATHPSDQPGTTVIGSDQGRGPGSGFGTRQGPGSDGAGQGFAP